MSSVRYGDIARKFTTRYLQNRFNVMEYQEKRMITELFPLKNYIINEIMNDASQGNKFRRFYYNELDTVRIYFRNVSSYEVDLMLKEEKFDICYDGSSFVVRWLDETPANFNKLK